MTQPNPHDALFKAAFADPEHAAGELRFILPAALVARMDFATLTLEPGSYIDEALKERQSDVLFSVLMSGKRTLAYVLFEHQSSVDRLMSFRLLRYMVRIWERHLAGDVRGDRLPMILPIVLHHSATGWTAATQFSDLLDIAPDLFPAVAELVPRFRSVIDDYYLTNPISRASAVMAECSALAERRATMTAAE